MHWCRQVWQASYWFITIHHSSHERAARRVRRVCKFMQLIYYGLHIVSMQMAKETKKKLLIILRCEQNFIIYLQFLNKQLRVCALARARVVSASLSLWAWENGQVSKYLLVNWWTTWQMWWLFYERIYRIATLNQCKHTRTHTDTVSEPAKESKECWSHTEERDRDRAYQMIQHKL